MRYSPVLNPAPCPGGSLEKNSTEWYSIELDRRQIRRKNEQQLPKINDNGMKYYLPNSQVTNDLNGSRFRLEYKDVDVNRQKETHKALGKQTGIGGSRQVGRQVDTVGMYLLWHLLLEPSFTFDLNIISLQIWSFASDSKI